MLSAEGKLVRSWREIATEAAKETDCKKLVEIIAKLCEILETIRLERDLGNPPRKHSRSAAA